MVEDSRIAFINQPVRALVMQFSCEVFRWGDPPMVYAGDTYIISEAIPSLGGWLMHSPRMLLLSCFAGVFQSRGYGERAPTTENSRNRNIATIIKPL